MMQNCFFDADQETLFVFMHCNQLERLSIKNATWAAVHLNSAIRFSGTAHQNGSASSDSALPSTRLDPSEYRHASTRETGYFWMIVVWGRLAGAYKVTSSESAK